MKNPPKTQMQTIAHLPIPNESENALYSVRAPESSKNENGAGNSTCKREAKMVYSPYFSDFIVRCLGWRPAILWLFLAHFSSFSSSLFFENILRAHLPILSYRSRSLFTSAFACVFVCCVCTYRVEEERLSERNQHMSIANDNGRTRWLMSDRKRLSSHQPRSFRLYAIAYAEHNKRNAILHMKFFNYRTFIRMEMNVWMGKKISTYKRETNSESNIETILQK